MTKAFYPGFTVLFLLVTFACQSPENKQTVNSPVVFAPTPAATVSAKSGPVRIDVPELAGKSSAELDKIFGPPEKITPAVLAGEKPGEYRLYKIAAHPKGLSVRFYRDRAVRFNLLLGEPEKSAAEALSKHFGIDVAKMTSVKGDSLSESWKGRSNGVNFTTAYAKKDEKTGDFVMVHAEVKQ